MLDQITIPLRPVLLFAIVLARTGGLVTFAPFWNHDAIQPRVRAFLAFVLALCVAPIVIPHLPSPPMDPIAFTLIIVRELLIGCALGIVGQMVMNGLQVAAEVITFQLGLSLASTIDPATRARTTALGILAHLLGLMVLLAADGHHWFLIATVRSFNIAAPVMPRVTPPFAEMLIRLSADSLAIGIALAAPVFIALLLVEFALAIAGRVAPQLQILMLSFPIKIAVGLWVIGATLYFLPGAARTAFTAMRANLLRAINAI